MSYWKPFSNDWKEFNKENDGKFIIVFDEGLCPWDSDRLQDMLARALEEYGEPGMIYSSVTSKVTSFARTKEGEESTEI